MSDTILIAIAAFMMVLQAEHANSDNDFRTSSLSNLISAIAKATKPNPADIAALTANSGPVIETIAPQPVGTAMLAVLGSPSTKDEEMTYQD